MPETCCHWDVPLDREDGRHKALWAIGRMWRGDDVGLELRVSCVRLVGRCYEDVPPRRFATAAGAGAYVEATERDGLVVVGVDLVHRVEF